MSQHQHNPLEVMAVVYQQHKKMGFLQSDGVTHKDLPAREGLTYPQFSAECGFASGWNLRTDLVQEGVQK